MKFILFIILQATGGYPTVTTVDFNSPESCADAAAHLEIQIKSIDRHAKYRIGCLTDEGKQYALRTND